MPKTDEDPTGEFRKNYGAGVDFKEPHQVWIGVAYAYMLEGWGTSIYTYVDAVQDMFYIPPGTETPAVSDRP